MDKLDKLTKKEPTTELLSVIDYIKNNILLEYPSDKITPEHFLLSVLSNENCIAYKTINKVMFSESIETLKSWYCKYLSSNSMQVFDGNDMSIYDSRLSNAFKNGDLSAEDEQVNSGDVLYGLLEGDEVVRKSFRLMGVTEEQIKENIESSKSDVSEQPKPIDEEVIVIGGKPKSSETKKETTSQKKTKTQTITIQKQKSKQSSNEVEKNLTNLNNLAAEGKIDEAFENDDVIDEIFVNLQKKYKNNVILVGDSGCGKTATVKHIANRIINGDVPKQFLNKRLMQLDFMQLTAGTGFRGAFEAKFNGIVSDAKKSGNYIFFIDDIQSILGDKTKFGEVDVETMLDNILMEKSIQVICTANNNAYRNYIESSPSFRRRFQKIELETPSIEKAINILNGVKSKLELFHNVKYNDEVISDCVKLCKRYITENTLPDSAINVIDRIGAQKTLQEKDSEEIELVKEQLKINEDEKTKVNNMSYKDYDKYDQLIKKEIVLKNQLSVLEKKQNLNRVPYEVTEDDIRNTISEMSGIPIQNLTINDMDKLKNINKQIKLSVIGQDEAVDNVCNAIKKQKLGISNPDKPCVFLFTGSTGTGKTLLAKKIAKEVYGDEKYLVRLDMSEYSDKTSVTKLYGASAGYVGYDNGGVLTEAVKKNKHCVVLLDEIEKADEEVHNVFLQLFDDGRLTDNTGYVVDFKNVIIIMTSNVGAREIDDKGNGIGFTKDTLNNNEDLIKKAIKKKFKPEFINRINKIVYFNKLTDENIHDIIELELHNLEERLNNAGYYLEDGFIDDKLVQSIFDKIESNKYGARTIIRQIETDVEDVILDFILNNNIEKGHAFKKEELFS